jgi:iron complex outermembrane receptor protein
VSLGAAAVDFPTRDGLTYQRVSLPFTNALDGPTRGVEIAPSATFLRGLQVRGSYSFFSADLEAKPGIPATSFTTEIETGSPRHQVVVQGLLTTGRVGLSPTFRYVGARRATDIPAYRELDLPLSWRVNPRVLISLVGQNLLNARHPEWARDPGPTVEIKRSAYVKLTWTP